MGKSPIVVRGKRERARRPFFFRRQLGDNAGKISTVTWRRKVNSGAWSTVRTVDYDYYGSGDTKGTLGDLKMITVKDSAGTMIDKEYYRYYTTASSTGYAGGLKYVFGRESWGRLDQAFGDPRMPAMSRDFLRSIVYFFTS